MAQNIIKKDRDTIEVIVTILVKKENKTYTSYCPALELSSYGDTQKEAIDSFVEAMNIFIEETVMAKIWFASSKRGIR